MNTQELLNMLREIRNDEAFSQNIEVEPKTLEIVPKIETRGRKALPIPQISWNKPNTIISKETGVTVMTVIKWRKIMGFKPLNRGRPSKIKVKTYFH